MPSFDDIDKKRLQRAIAQNQLMLFVGAGFSAEAVARNGKQLPSSRQLAELLWGYLGYASAFDGSALKDLFHSALESAKGHAALRYFLEDHLTVSSYPSWYAALTQPFWYRIYTTNIDNLIERLYGDFGGAPRLDVAVAPRDDYRDRDQLLRTVQLVKLHGSLPGRVDQVTFSARQFAKRSGQRHDSWYWHFVDDFISRVTVFVGTELDEPLFLEYLESRQERARDQGEPRPGGFLIVPKISPSRVASLDSMGLKHISMNAREFLEWCSAELAPFPTREETLAQIDPGMAVAMAKLSAVDNLLDRAALEVFFSCFNLVSAIAPHPSHRKLFFIGQSPSWQDIAHGYDAPRDVNDSLIAAVQAARQVPGRCQLVAITGNGGSGKSTALMRSSMRLHQDGIPVHFGEGHRLPERGQFERAARALSKPLLLVIDGADVGLLQLLDLIRDSAHLPFPPVFAISVRGNSFSRFVESYAECCDVREVRMPNLSEHDTDSLLQTLEFHNALGKLKGMTPENRRREIIDRAWKQLLVALREATQSDTFDNIILGEYQELDCAAAQHMYLCAALATDAGYRLARGELAACVDSGEVTALSLLENSLRDVVIPFGHRAEFFGARHPLVAEYLVSQSAPRDRLREAYTSLLPVLAKSMPGPKGRKRDRAFRLYRQLINHAVIYGRFHKSVDDARAIFQAVEGSFSEDHHFWLQYGLLELEYGELNLASLYLNQAESLAPNDDFVAVSLGYLDLRKAREAGSLEQAIALRQRGEETLKTQIQLRGDRDA